MQSATRSKMSSIGSVRLLHKSKAIGSLQSHALALAGSQPLRTAETSRNKSEGEGGPQCHCCMKRNTVNLLPKTAAQLVSHANQPTGYRDSADPVFHVVPSNPAIVDF